MNMAESMAEHGGSGGNDVDFLLDPKVQDSIGRSLKAHYDDLVNSPVPDKFLVLLAQLEAQEQRAATGEAPDERN